ncbi:MAG: threonine/serine dehydratase, partial [Planctomycetota bacterium]
TNNLSPSEVYLKLENLQHSGSFKVRGALNKLLCLSAAELASGVVAASSGNHGAGVAYGLRSLGASGLIFVPEGTTASKLRGIRNFGAEVRVHGTDCVIAEAYAREYATERGMSYLSPYNDRDVVAGQGSIGVELERQLEGLDAVFVALGGGGLIAGIGSYLKSRNPQIEIVACSPVNSPVMHESIRAGRILEMAYEPTLSDSTAGGVEPGSITFDLCRKAVDRYLLVSEEEIADCIRHFLDLEHMLIEGAAAVAVAGFMQDSERWIGKKTAIVICGANISLEQIRAVLASES